LHEFLGKTKVAKCKIFFVCLALLILSVSCSETKKTSNEKENNIVYLNSENCPSLADVAKLYKQLQEIAEMLPDTPSTQTQKYCRDDILELAMADGMLEMFAFEASWIKAYSEKATNNDSLQENPQMKWLYHNDIYNIIQYKPFACLDSIPDDSTNRKTLRYLQDFYYAFNANPIMAIVYPEKMQMPTPSEYDETIVDGFFKGNIVLLNIDSLIIVCAIPIEFKNSKRIRFPYKKGDYTDFRFKSEEAINNDFSDRFSFTLKKLLFFRTGVEPDSVRILLSNTERISQIET